MEPRSQLKYVNIQSFVDSSFFTKLLQNKLEEYKLDDSSRPLGGFMTAPIALNKFNDRPIINLDYSSFEPAKNTKSTYGIQGILHNVNTIEDFKLLDKLALLKKWGGELQQSAQNGKLEQQFHFLSFSDLKKYRFYYWLAFPVLHSPWEIVERLNNCEYDFQIEEYLQTNTGNTGLFFQISKEDEIVAIENADFATSSRYVYVDACLSADGSPLIQLKNYLFLLALQSVKNITLFVYRNNGLSYTVKLALQDLFDRHEVAKVTGWERTLQGKLGPKLADLGQLINPQQLAGQAVDLNIKLMKWRVAPQLNLDIVKDQKVLLLGAGTLGSYVARILMGWGVRNITFVDSGRVSYSNPVRQPLFNFDDCFSDSNQGAFKAIRASEALGQIFPGVKAKGVVMEVPMIGHPVLDVGESQARQNFHDLEALFDENDAVFLLMDSRESRWLPTVMGASKRKVVLNAALGFDSYLVMRHHPQDAKEKLGCYYCNDVVAPNDLLSDRTLDQMCTVTRPGGAPIASALVTELLVSILQHPEKNYAGVSSSSFGEVPHQIRGFLHNFSQSKFNMPAYKHCSACSNAVVRGYEEGGWEFVRSCLNSTAYLEEVCGLKQVQEEAEKASAAMLDDLSFSDEDDF